MEIRMYKKGTKIIMKSNSDLLNTADLPYTYKILNRYLPRVLMSKCFNDKNLPFNIEVKSTEIGHLFEHILLEYLCQLKSMDGCSDAVFNGHTDWNWKKYPVGTFHITINTKENDYKILPEAIDKSVKLMKYILETRYVPYKEKGFIFLGTPEFITSSHKTL